MGNALAAAEAGLPLICSAWEATQTLPLVDMMFERLQLEVENLCGAGELDEQSKWSEKCFGELTAQRFEEAVKSSNEAVAEIK